MRVRRRPVGGQMADVVAGLAHRFRFEQLAERHDRTQVLGLFSFVNGLVSIALLSLAALVTGQPFIFPSLGPTAFLFFYAPETAPAWPRNTIVGHLIGVLAGWASLFLFGLSDAGPALEEGVTAARVGAAALSLGTTAGLMTWLKVPHPPAGATTLIVSLGLLTTVTELAVLMMAVVLLTGQALVVNRLAGIAYPWWSRPARP